MILSRQKLAAGIGVFVLLAVAFASVHADTKADAIDVDSLRETSLAGVRTALKEEEQWVKVHAAETLLFNNYRKGVREEFLKELEKSPSETYKIGIWRVLVQAAGNDKAFREKYLNLIIKAAKTPDAPNRGHALETLGKLGWYEDTPEIIDVARKGKGGLQALAMWVISNSKKPEIAAEGEAGLAKLLASDQEAVRGSVAYSLRYMDTIGPNTYSKLIAACDKEPSKSSARVYLLSALYVHSDSEEHKAQQDKAKDELLKYVESGSKGDKNEVACALAEAGDMADISTVQTLLNDSETDVRVYATNALLRIERRQFRGLQWPDWGVIALYGLFMLGVGAWCAKRQDSTEEYFLASRNMNPIIIGISMFATLLSTISYLGTPGEIIKHGPVMMSVYLAVPFIYGVVGYLLVPYIMKLKITSAYELLEKRLGLPTRILGSSIFIITRLVWMAMLVYIAAKLMCEMMNWGEDKIPLVVIITGILAVAYTAMGGLRAVVITDVFQFFILIGGALLTVILITVKMGGFEWFPTQWASHWDTQPLFSWNLTTRATLIGAVVSCFFWWVCTAGSDQVAIQRYLATRDAKAARKAFLVNAISDMSVGFILYTVGFALLGFYAVNQHMIPDGKSLIANADYLFPRYIANSLPVGCAGLVVAGMLAAAMSSLDSGINSIVTVFFKDFAERLRRRTDEAAGEVQLSVRGAKYLVMAIGVAVVLLSSQVGKVSGNIVEVTNKTNGLFVGPLFGLFFMAMFVRKATGFGAVIGAIYGLATAVIIAYWDTITGAPASLSFQWIIPLALFVQIPVGIVASRLPVKESGFKGLAYGTVVMLLPLVAVWFCLAQWGLEIAKATSLGFVGN